MPDSHSLLSASSSKQWLHCTPSARLQERFPNKSSVYAEEGTFAHSVCEYKVKNYLWLSAMEPEGRDGLEVPELPEVPKGRDGPEDRDGTDRQDVPEKLEENRQPHSEEFESEELEQSTDVYYEFVVSTIEEMKRYGCEPLVLVEERVDYSHIAPSGFGTADMLIIGRDSDGKGLLHVIDYKHGKGVFVDADHNSQMMLYALGGLHAYGYIYPVETVRMSIIQPRIDNISTFECGREELEAWGESIKPLAQMAYEGKGEQKAGDWCRFCRAKPICRACKEEAMALCREDFLDLDSDVNSNESADGTMDAAVDAAMDTAADVTMDAAPSVTMNPLTGTTMGATKAAKVKEVDELPQEEETDLTAPYQADRSLPVFKPPGLVPLSELTAILPTLNRINSWIESVFAYISTEAINNGTEIPGYKVVEGRSKRIFSDTEAVARTAVENGFTDIYKKQLITLTDFEKKMGKKKFNELLGQYVMKPPGKLTLVPESDPRPPVDICKNVASEFTAL